nr:hypothetical protein BaRGS_023649 [Batillaria attramentaria]
MGTGIFLLASDEVETSLSAMIDMNIPLEFVYTAACIMIGVGSFVFFVGFCGCCGAMRESAIMLGICCGELSDGELESAIMLGIVSS